MSARLGLLVRPLGGAPWGLWMARAQLLRPWGQPAGLRRQTIQSDISCGNVHDSPRAATMCEGLVGRGTVSQRQSLTRESAALVASGVWYPVEEQIPRTTTPGERPCCAARMHPAPRSCPTPSPRPPIPCGSTCRPRRSPALCAPGAPPLAGAGVDDDTGGPGEALWCGPADHPPAVLDAPRRYPRAHCRPSLGEQGPVTRG